MLCPEKYTRVTIFDLRILWPHPWTYHREISSGATEKFRSLIFICEAQLLGVGDGMGATSMRLSLFNPEVFKSYWLMPPIPEITKVFSNGIMS